ncbi:hypothetical protein ISN44_As12g005590 [Arabidopsis suecica]|uniref:DUF223 domain-containing protein n=1 Tax=Arabidopsis suecica TaxID=45249 RepID=A0A8T1YG43_ARASU|nr:hypothetical protein ISN44_As12g005590 [Arabidopsis suecica]KAG7545032.1 hypothetical protein ISN44_As12g005590 [Arabidopsis suecica]
MNFKLSPNFGSYRATRHSFKIFLTWSTIVIVKPCEEIPNHSLRFSFIPSGKLQRHDENVFLDVIGEIVGMNDLKEITIRNAPSKLLNVQTQEP